MGNEVICGKTGFRQIRKLCKVKHRGLLGNSQRTVNSQTRKEKARARACTEKSGKKVKDVEKGKHKHFKSKLYIRLAWVISCVT